MIAISLVALLAVMAQPVPAGSAMPQPAESAMPAPADSAVPATPAPPSPEVSGAASPEAGAPASPAASVAPTPTLPPAERPTAPPYGYRFVPRQPDHVPAGQPQIFAVYLNSNKLKSLGPIDIKVSTSPDVIKVFTESNGRENAIPMIGPGDFEAASKLPKLPFIASGVTTTLNFVAVGASGKRVSVPVPVLLQ